MVHGRWAVPFLSSQPLNGLGGPDMRQKRSKKSQTSPLIFSTLPPTIMEVEKNGIYISSISFPET